MIEKDDKPSDFLKVYYYAMMVFIALVLFESLTTIIADKVASRITGKHYNYWCTTYSWFCGWLG